MSRPDRSARGRRRGAHSCWRGLRGRWRRLALGACGKSNLRSEQSRVGLPQVPRHIGAAPPIGGRFASPWRSTPPGATRFARAVNLKLADVSGRRSSGATSRPRRTNGKRRKCGSGAQHRHWAAGAHPSSTAGRGLEHEMISSSVVGAARRTRRPRRLRLRLQQGGPAVLRQRPSQEPRATKPAQASGWTACALRRMQLAGPEATPSTGIRITAGSAPAGRPVGAALHRRLGFPTGRPSSSSTRPASCSPSPQRTEQQLLALLR